MNAKYVVGLNELCDSDISKKCSMLNLDEYFCHISYYCSNKNTVSYLVSVSGGVLTVLTVGARETRWTLALISR